MLDSFKHSIINSDFSDHESPRGPVPGEERVEGDSSEITQATLIHPAGEGDLSLSESLEQSHACYRGLAASLITLHQRCF